MFADKILGPVKQWGYLVKDLDQAMECWVEQLGVGPWWGYRNVTVQALTDGQTSEVTMSVGLAYHQGMQIELIHQTNDAHSPYSYFYENSDDALGAAFIGGPVAMAVARFDDATKDEAYGEYLESIKPYRNGEGYRIPGEFVVVAGSK